MAVAQRIVALPDHPMRYTLLLIVAGMLSCGSMGCTYKSMPMDAKDLAEHPLCLPAQDYRAKVFIDRGAWLTLTDLHFSRWDFSEPQGWKQGWYYKDSPVLPLTYTTRCDVDLTILKEDHQDQHIHYVYAVGDKGNIAPIDLPNHASTPLQSPTSAIPYTPFDIVLNQVGALSGKLPDKAWAVDNRLPHVKTKPGVMAFYFSHDGQPDSVVYVVEKAQVYSGWKAPGNVAVTPIGENPIYFIFASKGTAAWPAFEKDVMASLFNGSPDDMYAAIGTRNQ